jgi:hypothetical protein
MHSLSLAMYCYVIGMTLAALLYRESMSVMARGIKTSTLGLVRSERCVNLENQYLSPVTR